MKKLLLSGFGLVLLCLSGCGDDITIEEQTKPCLDKGGIPLFSWSGDVMVDCKFKPVKSVK